MATRFLPGVIAWSAKDDGGAAKRARDGDLALSEETDARGWSSSVPERSLALRHRRGPASGSASPNRGCGWVAAADELGCCYEEPASPDAVAAGTAAEETDLVDPSCLAFLSDLDLSVFLSELDPAPFVTDLDSGLVILDALNDDSVADYTADERGCRDVEAATPDVVGSGAADSDAEETVGSDPYFSFYFGMTLGKIRRG